jgi:hypothetical protein
MLAWLRPDYITKKDELSQRGYDVPNHKENIFIH